MSMTIHCPPPPPRVRGGAYRIRATAAARIAAAAALASIAGEASAAAVCSNTIGAEDWIDCRELTQGATAPIDIDANDVAISTNAHNRNGALLWSRSVGDIEITLNRGSIKTMGGNSKGIWAYKDRNGRGDIHIDLTDIDVETTGNETSHGVHGTQGGGTPGGRIDIDVTGGSIATRTLEALPNSFSGTHGIYGYQGSSSSDPNIDRTLDIVVENVEIETLDRGIFGVSTSGAISIDVTDGSIATTGEPRHSSFWDRDAYGVSARRWGAPEGGISIDLDDTRVTTTGGWAYGVSGFLQSAGTLSVRLDDTQVMTTGRGAHAVRAYTSAFANDERVFVRIAGADSVILAAGAESDAVNVRHAGLGDAVVEIADATLISRGRRGVFARIGEPRSGRPLLGAAGQLRVVQGGTIEARTGVLAWARRGGTVSETRAARSARRGRRPTSP